MATILLAGVLIALGVGLWQLLRIGWPRTESRLYQILVQRAGGDMERADRLIDFELRRHPDAARAKAIETAIWRLDRDRS